MPHNNQQLQEASSQRNRKTDSTSPITIGKGASARYKTKPTGIPTKQNKPTHRADDRKPKTRPQKQATRQPTNQTSPNPSKKGNRTRPHPGHRQPKIPKEKSPQSCTSNCALGTNPKSLTRGPKATNSTNGTIQGNYSPSTRPQTTWHTPI